MKGQVSKSDSLGHYCISLMGEEQDRILDENMPWQEIELR
jgi:hypothetical protein